MTMVPQYKKCPICRKYYSWNPDVGDMSCPNCGKEVRKKIWESVIKLSKILNRC